MDKKQTGQTPIIVTCTEPRCYDIVQRLKNLGYQAIAMPVLTVQPLSNSCPQNDYDAVLVTSRHAIGDHLPHDVPYIAIGDHTAQQLQAQGHNVVQIGQGGIHDLDLSAYNTILYPCAAQPSHIPDQCVAWPVYETSPIHITLQLPANGIIAIYSPRAAHIISPYITKDHIVVCLSEQIKSALAHNYMQALVVCDKPDYDSMIKLLCKTADRFPS